MNAVVFLIVTMGSHYGISYQGYGAVSVTEMPSLSVCHVMKEKVTRQIKSTDNLTLDSDELVISCEVVTSK